MLTLSNSTRSLLGTAAVVLAFGPLAAPVQADEPTHPLIGKSVLYVPKLSVALGDAERVSGFNGTFKEALASMGEKPQIVDYPKPASANQLRITAVVPPKGMEDQSIPVCAEKNDKIVGTWNITTKGEVQPVVWGGTSVAVGTAPACKEFILASRAEINRLAQLKGIGTPRAEAVPAPAKVSMLP